MWWEHGYEWMEQGSSFRVQIFHLLLDLLRVTQVLGNGCQRMTSPASPVFPYPGAPSLSDGLGLEIGLYALANECQQLLKTTGDSSTV